MIGIDTVKLLAPLSPGCRLHLHKSLEPIAKANGRKGPVWWQGYRVDELGTTVVAKGVGAADGYLIWEGSVPKALGLAGVASAEDVLRWEDRLGEVLEHFGPDRYRGRVDVTEDVPDPDGLVRAAAINWKPHARARYVQAVYQDLQTVFLHNKTRGVRVYDKYAEDGHDWARGITRIEYQIRGDWVARHGLRQAHGDLAANAGYALGPVVADLLDRAAAIGWTRREDLEDGSIAA